ncbi:GNAT family N-acetyltransferase [Neobacillus sp. D3-1R]|uniref:GNAT family N-acetyltransferase n=1 Tax=Neobacillus sp. D3-1R TaxID=3445778 RepID=UPI003F9FFA5F
MKIREISIDDAEKMVLLMKQVEKEAEYMLFEPGERTITAEQQMKTIESMKKEGSNSTILVAEDHENLIGFLFVIGNNIRRTSHQVYLVVGILEEYRGKGVGTKLFTQLDQWAQEHHIHRLELTVVTKNEAGVALYKKMGFEIEGVKRDSIKLNGEYADQYYMAKLV